MSAAWAAVVAGAAVAAAGGIWRISSQISKLTEHVWNHDDWHKERITRWSGRPLVPPTGRQRVAAAKGAEKHEAAEAEALFMGRMLANRPDFTGKIANLRPASVCRCGRAEGTVRPRSKTTTGFMRSGRKSRAGSGAIG